ncbi:DUF4129 domain-containing protein [Actinocrispum sp. NPDC049592]|uniref:DUF4129 domain-containing protein n=1 Tax=Actinocrispum sp. NPDC049592 TaxID=3154835 RepID=UPI00341AC2D6
MSQIPVEVTPDAARDAAARELSDPAYAAAEPSWLDRAIRWLITQIGELFGRIAVGFPGGFAGLFILLVLIIAVVIVIRLRVGPLARNASAAVFTGKRLTAADHRRAAEQAAQRGDFAEAVRERFRAIARGLEERGVLDERSGRTVDELAREAGARLPGHATALRTAARIFDEIWYGGRTATAQSYQRLADLDLALDGARR